MINKKKQFILKLSIGLLSLVFIFLFSGQAKASVEISSPIDIGFLGGNYAGGGEIGLKITTTETDNTALLCRYSFYNPYGVNSSFSYNGVSTSSFLTIENISGNYDNISYFLLPNPILNATSTLAAYSGYNWGSGYTQCYFLSGVDLENPVSNINYGLVSSLNGGYNVNLTTANNGLAYFDWHSSVTTDVQLSGFNVLFSSYSQTASRFGRNFYAQIPPNDFYSTLSNYSIPDYNQYNAFYINGLPPTGLTFTETQYNPVTGNVFIAGTCDKKGSGINQMSLYAYEVGTSTPQEVDQLYPTRSSLVSCLEDGTFTALYNGSGLTGTNRLVIDDSFYGTQIISQEITWQEVTGYIRFNYGDQSTINIDTSAQDGATTTLDFIYNICDDPNYSSTTSKIWLVNQTGDNFEDEGFGAEDYYQATTCSGVGSITFHLDQGQFGTVRAYYAYANFYGVEYLRSGLFYISASDNRQPCNPPTYDIATICADIEGTGTMAELKCGFKYALVSSGQFLFYPSCDSLNNVTGNYGKFKKSFPFNTYFDLTTTIDTAINDSLVSTTTQSISIPFIKQTSTSTEYYMLPIMSSTTISNTIGETNYNTMRTTFAFVWWILCAVIVFLIVTKV